MPPVDAKRELRAQMRAVRRAIAADASDRASRSRTICERVIAAVTAHFGNAPLAGRRLMTFEPLAGEPELDVLIEWASTSGVDVYVPEVDGSDLRVMPGDVDPVTLDVVVVPGLAFSRDGHRLGQGGGHFDRFLPRLAPGSLRIGVAFWEQIVEVVPVEGHDVVLDDVATDRPPPVS